MQAYHRNARQIWVFNVGDLKPLEIPITFAMALAWNVNDIKAAGLPRFFHEMAVRDFGSELANEVGAAWRGYDRLVSLRKHELIEPDTFSLLHYNEADVVFRGWKTLLDEAEAIHKRVPEQQKAASFQLILHPIKATYILIALQVSLGRNQMFARQRRNTANKLAQRVLTLFDADFDLSEEFHALLNGKWNHMLSQTHYGYGDTWHAPSRDMISGLCYVQRRQDSNPIVGQMGVAVEGHEGVRPGRINEESERTHPSRRDLVPGVTLGTMSRYGPDSRWFEIFTRGSSTIHWTATVPHSWMKLSAYHGTLSPDDENDAEVQISIDWNQIPELFSEETLIDVRSEEGDFEQIHLPVTGRRVPTTFKTGFVEAHGYVSIPATSCTVAAPYLMLPDTGRLQTGSVALDSNLAAGEELPYLSYNFYTFSAASAASLMLQFGTTLDVSPDDIMSYDFQLDNDEVQTHKIVQAKANDVKLSAAMGWYLADGWFDAAADGVWMHRHEIAGEILKPGEHTIRIRLRHSNVMLEKFVVDLGEVRESYLGPPPSFEV